MPSSQKLPFRKPSFFQKLFGLKVKYNALIALNNLLEQHKRDVMQINFDDVGSIADEYKIDFSTSFKKERLELYHQLLESSFSDFMFEEEEIKKLKHIKRLLLLQEEDCRKELECISAKVYMKQVGDFVEKGEINDFEQRKLDYLRKNLFPEKRMHNRFPKEHEAFHIRKPVLK